MEEKDFENIKNITRWAYAQGGLDTLYSVKDGLSVLAGVEKHEVTIEDVLEIVGLWIKDAEKKIKKKQEAVCFEEEQ